MKKQGTSASPTKGGGSPTRTHKSPTKLSTKARRAAKNAVKGDGETKEKKESGLASPISIKMKQSFIIKNADESFDAYY